MKKLLLLSVVGLFTVAASAQNESPNFESFELPTLPECWLTVNADGDTLDWENFYQVGNGNGGFIQGSTGVGAMSSASFDNALGALTPDNYLILPQLNVQAGEFLEWQVGALDIQFFAENYSVLVSTTGTDPVNFTDSIFEETLTGSFFEARSASLDAYIGQEIYVAFRHYNVTNQFVLLLDDVRYPTTVNDCPIIVGIEEMAAANEFKLFPNPSTGTVNIELGNKQDQLVEIYNLSGQQVYSKNFQANSGVISLDLAHLSKGMYTMILTSEGAVAAEKLILR